MDGPKSVMNFERNVNKMKSAIIQAETKKKLNDLRTRAVTMIS